MLKLANIINFARGTEPRAEDDGFLLGTLKEELELCKRCGLRSTVLLQYDALTDPAYAELLHAGYDVEIGLWLETVQPQAEEAGLNWRGRYVWDWDVRCAFLTGYTPKEREKLLDTAFCRFKETFGYFPTVAGSWTIDAYSLNYIANKYPLAAFCSCKEQFGTDGITVWGGPPMGAYFPSKKNALLPARAPENRIGVPVFRMLGADPIYQYDLGLGSPEANQQVASLEPVYRDGGGNAAWVDWFLRENYNDGALSLAYAQFGQENSFGWEDISKGLPMQLEKLKALADAGKVEVVTLGEAGRLFSAAYALTPPNSAIVRTDHKGEGRRTLWYVSRFYRVNLYYENGRAWVRDLQLYSDDYAEAHLADANTAPRCGQFALPAVDGFRFSKGDVRAGLYPETATGTLPAAPLNMRTLPPDGAEATWGNVRFVFEEARFTVTCGAPGFRLAFQYADLPAVPYGEAGEKTLEMCFRDFTGTPCRYALRLSAGRFLRTPDGLFILPENGEIAVCFDSVEQF